jgi:hypothetical protein
MPVDVVIRRQPVLSTADRVCELAECVEIGRVVQCQALIKSKTLTVFDLECDIPEV